MGNRLNSPLLQSKDRAAIDMLAHSPNIPPRSSMSSREADRKIQRPRRDKQYSERPSEARRVRWAQPLTTFVEDRLSYDSQRGIAPGMSLNQRAKYSETTRRDNSSRAQASINSPPCRREQRPTSYPQQLAYKSGVPPQVPDAPIMVPAAPRISRLPTPDLLEIDNSDFYPPLSVVKGHALGKRKSPVEQNRSKMDAQRKFLINDHDQADRYKSMPPWRISKTVRSKKQSMVGREVT